MERATYRSMRQLQRGHWWFRGRRAVLRKIIAQLGLPADARILEAGAGTGGNVPMLQCFGDVSAFDPDDEARSFCLAETGLGCLAGALPDENPFQGKSEFDLVVALDVIEHVDDDVGALKSLAACVREGGALLLTVPAYQWMFSSHDVAHHHKRRYAKSELESRLLEAGCRVSRIGHFNAFLFPAIAAVRLCNRLLRRPGRSDMEMPGRWLNALLLRVFAIEAKLLGRNGFSFGTSIFVVAEPTRTGPAAAFQGQIV